MSAWMNDAVPNHNGNGFPHMSDPNAAGNMIDPAAFMANQGQFNPAAQFANQQQMAGMQNGPMRHASPANFQQPAYQTSSVIPSKRQRPREDSITGSPRQNQGMVPTSRSETPQQQNFAGFQPGAAMSQQNPGQFSHLQTNGSANASPSPIMGNQMRPGSVPQRVATASPHPFSPGAQQFGSQASPIPSEHGTPQPNPYMQNMAQGFNSGFTASPTNPRPSPNPSAMPGGQMMGQPMGQMPQPMGQMPPTMYAQMQQPQQQQPQGQVPQQQPQPPQPQQPPPPQQQQQPQQVVRNQPMLEQQKMAAYQMRMQQQMHSNMQMHAQMQAQNMGRGMMAKQQMPGMPNGPVPNGPVPQGPMRPQHRSTPSINADQFMKNLTGLMSARGLPLNPNPMIGDRPVSLLMLFQAVQAKNGHKAVSVANAWPHIAQAIGFSPQHPPVASALKQIYELNLLKFEEVWQAQQKQRLMQQQHQQQQQHPNHVGPGTPQKQAHHGPPVNPGQIPPSQQPHMQQQTPVKPAQPAVNGFSTPQAQQHQSPSNAIPGHNRNSLSRGIDPAGVNDFSIPSPAHSRPGSMSMPQGDGRHLSMPGVDQRMPRVMEKSEDYSPCARELSTYGGVDLHAANLLGMELERWKPVIPPVNDLGNIDISALTRSLQSGIHGEVRLALDTLVTLSHSPNQQHALQLRYCDDLVEVLLECAEEQLEMLSEHTNEVSDDIQLLSYEEVLRTCRIETWVVREVPSFASDDYELDRAVDKLICISTILRNVSFPGEQNDNHVVLAEETVIKFLCTAIRYLGTRTMLLRTHANTLDFMKDVVILLSNIAGSIEIPGREQALCLLQFLLAFAPGPNPVVGDGKLFFTPYDPSIHSYLPHAVDALAKLFARDEPNRGHYKALFLLDAANSPSHDLLTRSFALATSPIPDKVKERDRPGNFPSLVEVRKPYLMQGLLSAEIIASLAPGPEAGLVKQWLASGNGLANTLFRLIQDLSHMYEQPQAFNRGSSRAPPRKDPELVYIAVVAGSLLRRLVEKARDSSSSLWSSPGNFLPPARALLDALSMQSPEWTKEGLLQQLSIIITLSS